MAAPRSTSLRALRVLSQQNPITPASPLRRSLHITGAFSAQPATGQDRSQIYRSRSVSDLAGECQRRNLRCSGSKAELVDRLSNHDLLQTRAFSIAMRRIDRQGASSSDKISARHYNTSRAMKTVKDSSTVDFAYMPQAGDFDGLSARSDMPHPPSFPDAYVAHLAPSAPGASPMKPEIYSVSSLESDTTGPSPMSEVVDNHALEIDPFRLTETVSQARRRAAAAASSVDQSEAMGAVKELWGGFLDDLLGPKHKAKPSMG